MVEASVISLSDGTDRSFYGRRADLEVKRAWKGGDAKDLSVYTGLSTEDCAYGFRKGVLYVVFAYKDEEGLLRTSSCSRTKPHGAAIEELKFLEKLESRSPRPLGGAAANHSLQPTRLLRRGSLRSVKLVGRAAELRIR